MYFQKNGKKIDLRIAITVVDNKFVNGKAESS